MLSRFLLCCLLAFVPCQESEVEPNGTMPLANVLETIPASPPWNVCAIAGDNGGGLTDLDVFKVPLWAQTFKFVELPVHFEVETREPNPIRLVVMELMLHGGLHVVGVWESPTGFVQTGEVPVNYYSPDGLDHIFAFVSAEYGTPSYQFRYW